MEEIKSGTDILLFAEYGRMGGTRTYFIQLLALYRKLNAQVTVIRTYEKPDLEIDLLAESYRFSCNSVSKYYGTSRPEHTSFPYNLLRERRAFADFVKELNPDLIVVSVGTPDLFMGVIGLAKKSLYILHTYPSALSRRHVWKRFIKRFIYRSLFTFGRQLLTVSNHSAKTIRAVWGLSDRNRINVVYSTVGECCDDVRTSASETKTILTVGHVTNYKNPHNWIKVAKKVIAGVANSPVKFIWVGEGDLLKECIKSVKEEGLEEHVKFVGLQENVEPYYLRCDVYFQPSLIESLGLSVLDALRHGKPCVVSNSGGLPEVVVNNECGLVVDANDCDAMVNSIKKILGDKTVYSEMSKSAVGRYRKVFSPQIWEEQMLNAHALVLDERG